MRLIIVFLSLLNFSYANKSTQKLNSFANNDNLTKNSLKHDDNNYLLKFEQFLSLMKSLIADVKIVNIANNVAKSYKGKIFLDRTASMLKIYYDQDVMLVKDKKLFLKAKNQKLQVLDVQDTPASLLINKTINFNSQNVKAKEPYLIDKKDSVYTQPLIYTSPVGKVKLNLFFQTKPFIKLLGWSIVNPDKSITNVYLDPESIKMSVPIDPKTFAMN